jgi:asparagine synthase (glutamine-hydrolysing)
LKLWSKCRDAARQFSNADNMALVGALSTQLLYEQIVRRAPGASENAAFRTVVDRLHLSTGSAAVGASR